MTEPSLKIVVEGRSDADLLRAVLGKEARRVRFYTGQGKISLASIGRNLLVHEGGPVLVVADADTTNPQQADEQKAMIRLALERVAPDGDFDVFLFVPMIEVGFFEAPEALRRLLNRDVSGDALREGATSPKALLAHLLGAESTRPAPGHADPQVGELLASGKQVAAFKDVVQRLLVQHAET